MNFTHGGLPEKDAWSWTPENQRKLGQIVIGLEKKETAYKAWSDYYTLKRYFMVETWTKFVCDLTDFRKQNGFRGINELLAEANPLLIPKECVMVTVNDEALRKIANAYATISEGILMMVGIAPAVDQPTKGKAAKAEKPAEPAVDFAKLRDECKVLVLDQVKVKGKDKILEILGKFKVAKLPDIKDADLPALKAALDAEKAIEPEAVA